MDHTWAPWRMEYILNPKPQGCIFCTTGNGPDAETLVLYRSPWSVVMLNRYPYTNGHLLVAPHRHCSDLEGLSDDEMTDLFRLMRLCCRVLSAVAAPQGFNTGMNLGKAAGAGVDDHLHLHVVPRWNGDTNFMTVIGDLRVMPENLNTTYERLLPHFIAYDTKS